MNRTPIRAALALSFALAAAWPQRPALAEKREDGKHQTEGVQPKFGLAAPSDGPFPSDRFTKRDETQNTCERVNLPLPKDVPGKEVKEPSHCRDDSTAPSTCIEMFLLNELDGFNTRPRISIPFKGDIDLKTVKKNIFLVSLGDSMIHGAPGCLRAAVEDEDEDQFPRPDAGSRIDIDQAVWDPATQTLYVEAAETLEQHTRYAVLVTRGVKADKTGEPIEAPKAFKKFIAGDDEDDTPVDSTIASYQATLRRAVNQAHFFGVKRNDIAVASVFTTLSVTAPIEKIHAAAMATPAPSPADFNINIAKDPSGNAWPAVFDLSKITKMTHNRETAARTLSQAVVLSVSPTTHKPNLNLQLLQILDVDPKSPAIKSIAFFRIKVPNYLRRGPNAPDVDDATCAWDETFRKFQKCATLEPFGTYSGTPTQFGTTDLYVELILPSGTPPAGGWPVVLWGHERSLGSSIPAHGVRGTQLRVAAVFASHHMATLSWSQVGFGFGPASTVTVEETGKPVLTLPFSGRAYDLNHDTNYDQTEGSVGFNETRILFDRDANRQGIADIAQIIRAIEVGVVEFVDVDGVHVRLDPEHVYYGGLSKGAVLGVLATAVESRFQASALSSPNGFIEVQKVPAERGPNLGLMLKEHVPSLINPPDACALLKPNPCATTQIGGIAVTEPFYNENMPEPGQQPISNDVPGALEIQDYLERLEWLNANNAAGAFMKYLRSRPINLSSNGEPRPVLIQMAKGDRTTVNPAVAEGIRAGRLADRVTLFRWDLFPYPPGKSSADPHTFLINTDLAATKDAVSLPAQKQIAVFYESSGAKPIDPDGAGPWFETPAVDIPSDFGFVLQ